MVPIDNQKEATRKGSVLDRLKKKHPDRDFVDDEAIFGAIDDDYGEAESTAGKMAEYEKNAGSMVDMFYKNPRVAAFFNACKDGEDPIAFMIENFGDDFREALDSEEGRQKYGEKHQAWLEKVASEKALEEESQRNLDVTITTLGEVQKEHGLTDEQATEVFDKVHQVILDGIKNNIRKETFEMALKAMNYESAVSEADRIGEIRGRNQKIEEKLKRKGDSVEVPPTLNNTSGGSVEPGRGRKPYNPFLAND